MAYEPILLDRRGPVAFIRFNRPEKLNAMNSRMKDEIIAALAELDADEAVRVVILTGQGDRAFVAGAHITEFRDRTPLQQGDLYQRPLPYDAGDRVFQPRISRVNGDCPRGGCG